MKDVEFLIGEEIVKETGGDCWETPGSLKKQVPGKYIFTNRRIIFVGNGVNSIGDALPSRVFQYGYIHPDEKWR